MFVEKKKKINGIYKTRVIESGDKVWDKIDGERRKKIIKEVGMEYKQINILASLMAKVLIKIPELLQDEEVQADLALFNKIDKIRKGEL